MDELEDLSTMDDDLARFQADPFVSEALSKGVDLRQYSLQISSELESLQVSSIPDYIMHAPETARLYEQITECDGVLESMESVLLSLQSSLGGISDEIKHLQTESMSMSVKLKNRRAIESDLRDFLQQLVVPDALIVGICKGTVNDKYVDHLKKLDAIIRFARDQSNFKDKYSAPCDAKAVQDVEPQLEKLRLKAVSKVRLYLLDLISQLKKTNTNVGMIQQNVFLKSTFLVNFLQDNAPAVYEEVRSTYIETMSYTLHRTFKSYYTGLLNLQKPRNTKEDTIGAKHSVVFPPPVDTSLSLFKSVTVKTESMFSGSIGKQLLYDREHTLGKADAPPLSLHATEREKVTLSFESIFRSVQCHLMNSVTAEFLFTLDFFGTNLFSRIFAKTLSLCLEMLENELYNCYDVVTVLLLIKTTQSHQLVMERRKVPCLDGYFDHILMMLWPQFKKIFNNNLDSLKQFQAENVSLGWHYVTHRYIEFSSAVYALNYSLRSSDAMLAHNLSLLRDACIACLERMAVSIKSKKHKMVFLVNNFDHVLTFMKTVKHNVDKELLVLMEDKLKQYRAEYIEMELYECYPMLIDFVKAEEARVLSGEEGSGSLSDVTSLLSEFSGTWKNSLDLLNTSVHNYFSNNKKQQGTSRQKNDDSTREMVKQIVTQLLLYYTRLQDIVKKQHGNKVLSKYVRVNDIMEEIKRFSKGVE